MHDVTLMHAIRKLPEITFQQIGEMFPTLRTYS